MLFKSIDGSLCGRRLVFSLFFFVQIYSTTLTSHLMDPNEKPIANTLHELANDPSLGLTFGFGYQFHLELINPFSQIDDMKKVSENIKRDPSLLCKHAELFNNTCLKRVREDRNVSFSSNIQHLKLIMQNDLKSTGVCHYYLLKDTTLYNSVFTFWQKRSPYTESISIAALQLKEAGLFDKWESMSVPNPRQCMKLNTHRDVVLERLSLSNLGSAFAILGIGYSLSLLVFLVEKITNIRCN